MKKDISTNVQDAPLEKGQVTENAYRQARSNVIDAQSKVYCAVNSAMVETYWKIGKTLDEVCGENYRAAYGKQVLQYIAERLAQEFGKGFDASNLRRMRQFYRTFPIRGTVRRELSWSHYRRLLKVEDAKAPESAQ